MNTKANMPNSEQIVLHSRTMIACSLLALLVACGGGGESDPLRSSAMGDGPLEILAEKDSISADAAAVTPDSNPGSDTAAQIEFSEHGAAALAGEAADIVITLDDSTAAVLPADNVVAQPLAAATTTVDQRQPSTVASTASAVVAQPSSTITTAVPSTVNFGTQAVAAESTAISRNQDQPSAPTSKVAAVVAQISNTIATAVSSAVNLVASAVTPESAAVSRNQDQPSTSTSAATAVVAQTFSTITTAVPSTVNFGMQAVAAESTAISRKQDQPSTPTSAATAVIAQSSNTTAIPSITNPGTQPAAAQADSTVTATVSSIDNLATQTVATAAASNQDEASTLTGTADATVVAQVDNPATTTVASSTQVVMQSTAATFAGEQDRLTALTDPTLGLVSPQRIAVEDWAGASARVAASTSLTNWVKWNKSAVEAWAARQRERADLIGGYIHDYFDPNTGIPVVWSESTPEPADGTTEQATRYKQAWVAYVRQRNINYTLTAARLYRLTGDAAMGNWARQQLDFYAQQYLQWPLRTYNGRARMFRHGLDEAYNAFALIDAARLLRDSSSQQVKRWNDKLFVPMATNLQTVTSPMTNVALWHAAAIAAIAMQVEDSSLLDLALNGTLGIRTTLSHGITADHIWFEGSLSYNEYVIDALSKLLVHASLQGKAATFEREWADARRLLLATMDFRFDDGSLPNPGDMTSSLRALDSRSYTLLYRIIPTWYGSNAAAKTITWDSLLDPPVAFGVAEPSLPSVQTRNFPAIRMAVLRAGDWQAFVHYGQAATNHWQEEALTYELHQGTNRISTDSGTVAYSSPYHVKYFRRAAAQNVPLIDGVGQQRWETGVVREFSATTPRLVVDHAAYRDGVAVSRSYDVSNTGFTESTAINVTSGSQSRRLGSAFHTDCSISPLSGLNAASSLPTVPNTEATAYWRMQHTFEARGPWSVRLDCGDRAYQLQVQTSSDSRQRIYLGKAPTRPLPTERGVLYYEIDGTTAEFTTEIRQL